MTGIGNWGFDWMQKRSDADARRRSNRGRKRITINRCRILMAAGILSTLFTGCAGENPVAETVVEEEMPLVLGFAQVGAESDWRTANTQSIKTAAQEAGFILKFEDAQQKQENQIKAIRSFVAQRVDVIAFSPVVETGWDMVLQEAKMAGIPVILTDRGISTTDETLYETIIGSDFTEEGRRAGRWLEGYLQSHPREGQIRIVELEGTEGSAPAIERKQGFQEVMASHNEWTVIDSADGDFTRAKGREIMETFLKQYPRDIDVLFAHNDDMAIGAIKAIEAAGLKPGKDILIVSVDGTKLAFDAMLAGKLNCTVECNPLLGPQLVAVVKDISEGKTVPKRILIDEQVFTTENARIKAEGRIY